MSNRSKIAAITAASIGMVLTQGSTLLAEKQDSSAPKKVTKIAAPIDLDEEVFYSALSDEAVEKAGSGGGVYAAMTKEYCGGYSQYCNKAQPVKKPASSQPKKPKQ